MKNKNTIYYSLILLSNLASFSMFGQISSFKLAINKADSLGGLNNYEAMDSVLDLIILNPQYNMDSKEPLIAKQKRAFFYGDANYNVKALKVCFEVIEKAHKLEYYAIEAETLITQALIYEKLNSLEKCKKNLDRAHKIIKKNNLDTLNSFLFVRLSSYYRFVNQFDLTLTYAKDALKYGKKYHQPKHTADACLLIAFTFDNIDSSNYYIKQAIFHYKGYSNYKAIAAMFDGLASNSIKQNNLEIALIYNDSSLHYSKLSNSYFISFWYKKRATIYELQGHLDSANYYHKVYSEALVQENQQSQTLELNKIIQSHESEKKMAIIEQQQEESKKQKFTNLLLVVLFLLAIVFTLYYYKSYKSTQKINKTIESQAEELKNSLEEKQILLKEVNHRVKNNLQMMMALLEIQSALSPETDPALFIKSSVNRIQAMAFLHNDIFDNENISKISVQNYIENIFALTNQSYSNTNLIVKEVIKSDFLTLPIKELIPLGLITLELITNSYKHAFHDKESGEIKITLKKINQPKPFLKYTYEDNGIGFDTSIKQNGAGCEIINSLVDQLNGEKKGDYNGKFYFEITIPLAPTNNYITA